MAKRKREDGTDEVDYYADYTYEPAPGQTNPAQVPPSGDAGAAQAPTQAAPTTSTAPPETKAPVQPSPAGPPAQSSQNLTDLRNTLDLLTKDQLVVSFWTFFGRIVSPLIALA